MTTTYSSWANYASTSVSIRFKYDVTETDTTYTLTITAQRWDKYALVPSGVCWISMTDTSWSSSMSFPSASSNNSTRNIGSMTHTYNKTTSVQTITIYFETDQWFDAITDSGWTRVGVVKPTWTLTIPKKTSYTVKYAANGGSSTPSSQTKWHGTALTLAAAISRANTAATAYTVTLNHNYSGSTNTTKSAARTTKYTFSKWKATNGTLYAAKASYTANAATTMTAQWTSSTTTAAVTLTNPTRNGYTFDGWATSSTGSKAYNGGASYTPSGNTTLYARWYRTVTFNANGGSGAPAAQKALATSAIILSSTKPTKTGYKFTGWNTSANGTGTSYVSGGSYAAQKPSVMLYAQWQILLTVSITSVTRCDANGNTDPLGTCAKVVFNWSSGSGSSVSASFNVSLGSQSTTVTRTAASYTGETAIVTGLNPRTSYTATVTGTIASAGTSVSATKSAPVAYTSPVINSVSTNRVNASQILDDEGTVLKLDVKWSVCQSPSQTVAMTIQAKDQNGAQLFPQPVSLTVPAGIYSGTDTFYVDDEEFSVDSQYTVTVTVKDALNVSASKGSVLSTAYFPMDVLGDQYYYQPTTDSAIDPDKRYYAMDADSGWYKLVEEPVVADIGSYYEATGPRPGHGISFGAACKEEGFHVLMPMQVHGNDLTVEGDMQISGGVKDLSGNDKYLPLSGGTMTGVLNMGNNNIEDIERVFAHYHVMTVSGTTRGNIYVSGDYLYIQGYDTSGASTCQYRFNLNNFGIAYRLYTNGAWDSWTYHIYDATASRTKNTFLAAPSTADGAATFRAISTLDLPNVSSTTATTSSTSAPYSYTFDMSAHAMYSLNMTSTVSIPNSTWVEVVRIRFTDNASTGTLYVKVRWGSNTTGQRYIGHNVASSTSGLEAPGTNTASCVSYPAPALRMSYTYPVGSVAAGTYMGIYVYQNSGAALNIGQVFVRYMASAR